MEKLIYIIGRKCPLFRKIIYKLTGKWYWGIMGWVKDYSTGPKDNQNIPPEWLDKQLDKIFKLK